MRVSRVLQGLYWEALQTELFRSVSQKMIETYGNLSTALLLDSDFHYSLATRLWSLSLHTFVDSVRFRWLPRIYFLSRRATFPWFLANLLFQLPNRTIWKGH